MSSEGRNSEGMVGQTGQSILSFVQNLLDSDRPANDVPNTVIRSFMRAFVGPDPCLFPLLDCREVVRVGEVTRIPDAPQAVCGLVSVRGKILPLIDTRICLAYSPAPLTPKSRQVVVEVEGRLLALLVDGVTGIKKASEEEIGPPLSDDPHCVLGRILGVEGPLRILSAERLVAGFQVDASERND